MMTLFDTYASDSGKASIVCLATWFFFELPGAQGTSDMLYTDTEDLQDQYFRAFWVFARLNWGYPTWASENHEAPNPHICSAQTELW